MWVDRSRSTVIVAIACRHIIPSHLEIYVYEQACCDKDWKCCWQCRAVWHYLKNLLCCFCIYMNLQTHCCKSCIELSSNWYQLLPSKSVKAGVDISGTQGNILLHDWVSQLWIMSSYAGLGSRNSIASLLNLLARVSREQLYHRN